MSRKGTAAALAAAALFGGTNVVTKVALRTADPLAAATVTFAAGALVFAAWLPSVRPQRRDLPLFAASGVVGGALSIAAFYTGISLVQASTASLLLPAEMAFTAVLAFVILRERLDRRDLPGVALLAAAALVVATVPAQQGVDTLAGAGLVLFATLCWGVDNVVNANLSKRYSVRHLAAVRGLLGAATMFAIALAAGADFAMPWGTFALLVGNGVVGWGLAIVVYYVALREAGATKAVVVFSTSALWGALAAFVFLAERVRPGHVGGVALALLGFWFLWRRAAG